MEVENLTDLVRDVGVIGLEVTKVMFPLLQYNVYVFDTMCFLC